ncbi:MAG: pyruvate, phosphate dikinase [Alphaproteobacteria bacterium]|nr:pyruvate, phosphate dikinase [Alphaproteobacteria bacterium]OJV16090.1 MAG: pyruvate, phosphate dikinase [Alphaproteobacteria bacterium 33-17]
MEKLVYTFGDGKAEGNATMKDILGGKGANLADMCARGVAVPPGFTITTNLCVDYYKNNKTIPDALKKSVSEGIDHIQKIIGNAFGDSTNPLLVSVRSGARASMPGMMDTILNLGLNEVTVEALAKKTNNPRFAYDSYRRFIQMYSDVVLGIHSHYFEDVLESEKIERDAKTDNQLDVEALKTLVNKFKAIVKDRSGKDFPEDVNEQLWGAIQAVFDSWMNARAITYRKMHNIPESWGTAVNIQAMVFGNMGDTSLTGVCFTRDPSTGENYLYGEYLVNAQGEDVVAGIRTPQQITIHGKNANKSKEAALEEVMPGIFNELQTVANNLEANYRDMQDIEFTVQEGKLWILQTRSGKRSANAAINIAVDMCEAGTISKEEAISRIVPTSLDQLLHPTIDPKATYTLIDKGLPASPGAACGAVVFSAEDAEKYAEKGIKVILVRIETSPEDIHGMLASEGILTSRGGMTSHAAVVARGMGKTCVCGASKINIDYKKSIMTVGDKVIKEGDMITINGSNGEVILGEVPTVKPDLSDNFQKIMSWADSIRKLKVRTNAETPQDVEVARQFGAEGIGLCRTEHMFFQPDRIIAIREMIIAENQEDRRKALSKLMPMQQQDFEKIFTVMDGLPVTIRLLDPPLHEFLPNKEEEFEQVANVSGKTVNFIKQRAEVLHESNPMLGHRGCRLAMSYPEIYEMQVEAIIRAAITVKEKGVKVAPEIMIPLVMSRREIEIMKDLVTNTATKVFNDTKSECEYSVGTMIELPRAALKGGEIAEIADFFSFGTNDLTQTTLGMSRDDSASFIGIYKDKAVFEHDPFACLDTEGVGELMQIAVERGRKTQSSLKLGICGEHGGNPEAIAFCHEIGLDYVSCSPFRVPIARLAAAQAKINSGK